MSAVAAARSFRPDIEGLRALAVLGVIAFHFGATWLPGGFVGVDIFFVISGYLITRLLQQEIARRGTVNLWAFYARRARRLLPASLFVILVTLAVGYFILAPAEQQLYSKGALFASTYMINVWLIRWSLDYFAPDATSNPFIHFWSLSVEEQFYLAWPALLLLFAWLRPGKRGLFLLMAGVAAASFAAVRVADRDLAALGVLFLAVARLGIRARRPCLDGAARRLGAALALCARRRLARPGADRRRLSHGVRAIRLSRLHRAGAGGGQRHGAARRRAAEPHGPNAVLALAPAQWVGKLSYSLYLWHWPVVVYAAMLVPELTSLHIACWWC